jgi:putative two-component system response regulator
VKQIASGRIADATILIIDDQESNVLLLTRILARAGYANLHSTTDPREAIDMVHALSPDIVLLDLHMPHVSGYDLLQQISDYSKSDSYLPILVLTADVTQEAKERALSSGAKDFLTKPIDPTEVLLRIHNLLETRFLHLELVTHNANLEMMVLKRSLQLESAIYEIVYRLARAAEFRDGQTGQHTNRVAMLAGRVGTLLGMNETEVELLSRAAPLHDVGKIGVPDSILLKRGPLSREEFAEMQKHVNIGGNILGGSEFPLLQMAEVIARTHHERWDGSGYSVGLDHSEIPLAGRIVSVVDVFDALIHERPYKPAWPLEKALEEIRSVRGRQFDPDVVDAFMQVVSEIRDPAGCLIQPEGSV